ncbi:unnamed protein product [Caenorhabditis brenneri]
MLAAPPAPKKARKSETKIELVDISDDETDSPFTLYFVSLPDVNVTEKKHLDEVFKVAKKAGITARTDRFRRPDTSDTFR